VTGLILLALLACSCSMFDKQTTPTPAEELKRLPDTREFGDVLIPRDMDVDKNASLVQNTASGSLGLLRLHGRVEMASLMRFFQNNMPKDGWRQVTEFRSPNSLLVFQKENRLCLIAIEDSDFQTFMDVWVVPANESIDLGPRK
jgi:hypothetical protein